MLNFRVRGLFTVWLAIALTACATEPGGEPLQHTDDFSNPESGFPRQTDADATTDYSHGEYMIEIVEPDLNVWAIAGPAVADATVTVQARTANGSNNNAFGVVCRYRDDKNFYFLVISADGFYAIGKLKEGMISYLTPGGFQQNENIQTGQATHTLAAACLGGTLTLSVNGFELASVTDPDYRDGQTGLIAATFDGTPVEIRFDNFKISPP